METLSAASEAPVMRLGLPWRLLRRSARVPLVNQLGIADCGAACLAMILNHHGRATTLAECRDMCGVGRGGLSARTMAEAARRLGLRVKAYSMEPEGLRYLRLPAIAHWQFNHFVVVERWSAACVEVADPAAGRRRLTAEEFAAGFTGVVLALDPASDFEPRRRNRSGAWRAYLRVMLSTSGVGTSLAQILVTSILLQGIGLALPVLTKLCVDRVIPHRIESAMALVGLGLLIIVLTQFVVGYLRSLLLIYLRGHLDTRVMFDFFERLLGLPFRFFQERTSGDLLLRLNSNSIIREMLTNQTVSLLLDGSFVILYLALVATQAPAFSVLVIGLGVLQALVLLGTRRKTRELMQRDLATKSHEQSYLVEVMSGIAMVKASGSESRALDRWADLFFSQLNVSLDRGHLAAFVENAMGALRILSPAVLLWFGASQVLAGRMTVGTMLALNALAAAFLAPLAALMSAAQQLETAKAHLERIADVLEAPPEQGASHRRRLIRLTGRIEVRSVGFSYSRTAPAVLSGVSFAIEPGQKVALVGATGSGKSTLLMLLLGLFEPTEGEILYDGVRLADLDYRHLRGQVGVVLQESFLFTGSIRENIASSDPRVSPKEVMSAAAISEIAEEIEAMPMAYETIISGTGMALSGGQRQRLSIARAVLNRPAVLMLDEATSHLDVRTEARIDSNLSRLDCTRLVVAHRLSTVRNADLILVLDQGRIVERGRHEELSRRAGPYAALIRSQVPYEPLRFMPAIPSAAHDVRMR